MTTPEEIIAQQRDVIEGYKSLVQAQDTSKETLYKFLEAIHASLLLNDPVMTENAAKHLGKLLESKK